MSNSTVQNSSFLYCGFDNYYHLYRETGRNIRICIKHKRFFYFDETVDRVRGETGKYRLVSG